MDLVIIFFARRLSAKKRVSATEMEARGVSGVELCRLTIEAIEGNPRTRCGRDCRDISGIWKTACEARRIEHLGCLDGIARGIAHYGIPVPSHKCGETLHGSMACYVVSCRRKPDS